MSGICEAALYPLKPGGLPGNSAAVPTTGLGDTWRISPEGASVGAVSTRGMNPDELELLGFAGALVVGVRAGSEASYATG